MKLTEDQCALLEEFANQESLTIREDYSGRGMMGSTCFGFVSEGLPYSFLIRLGQFLAENEELNLIQSLTDSCRSDSMGYDFITYFPRVQWMEQEEDEEEEFEDVEE